MRLDRYDQLLCDPDIANYEKKKTDYKVFCDVLEGRIYNAIQYIESSRNIFFDLKENALTGVIIANLKPYYGNGVQHDSNNNGHCDIVVESLCGFKWLGEAKLDNGPAYSLKGFKQLYDRYLTGNITSSRGGVIIYTVKEDRFKCVDDLVNVLEGDYKYKELLECPYTLCKSTIHLFKKTNHDVTIKYFSVSLHHQPTA